MDIEQKTANIRIGIDFGGVIVRNSTRTPNEDTRLAHSDGIAVAQEGVVEAVREIVSISGGHVWIISKAGARMQARTRDWLESTNFFSQTGMSPENLSFCIERQEKESLCRKLKITHFIDDRVHIMQILRHTVPNLYLFGARGGERFCPPWATFVVDWMEIVALLNTSLKNDFA